MKKKGSSKYAKVDPAFFADGLFLPTSNKNKAINIEHFFDKGIVRFRGVQLGVAHQSVLLAICARMGRSGELIVKGTKNDLHAMQMSLLDCSDFAKNTDCAILEATAGSLLTDAGLGVSGRAYDRFASYLTDMQTLTVYRQVLASKIGGGSNLLSFSHEADCFRISLNWRLASAILGDAQFVQVSLFERHQLSDPVSKILHAWLSSILRPNKSLGFGDGVFLDSLIQHVWGKSERPKDQNKRIKYDNTKRSRRIRLRKALGEINNVNDWICHNSENDKNRWYITRPSNLGNDDIASPGEMEEAEKSTMGG